jgi:hypothetical protein
VGLCSAIGGDSGTFRVYGRWYTVRAVERKKIVGPLRGKYIKSGAKTGGSETRGWNETEAERVILKN